ncbi:acetyltransferase [Enterococcus dongliensis]|uniref:acetyltransferase n=1 Tax=Enterococcus dongliensis TaxID=2559925 RepID=UPI00288F0834|nr:acetyltransferase [Enterococcus dongliensis]MDT2646134.1 acetyltransferase [Enterococcus dongliensis]
MKLVIVGAGGFAKEIAFLASRIPDCEVIGFVDDNFDKLPDRVLDKPVLGNVDILLSYQSQTNIAIGIANPFIKRKILNKLRSNSNLVFPNLVDPSALLGIQVELGMGNILMANTTYTADITIGNFNMINIGSTIGHDSTIGNFNAIYPNANISGDVRIGEYNEIGTGAKVIQGLSIGNQNIIGAGAVVIRNIKNRTKNVGVPTKIIESWD